MALKSRDALGKRRVGLYDERILEADRSNAIAQERRGMSCTPKEQAE